MSNDSISRQAAINMLEERLQANGYSNTALVSELNRSIGYLMHMPSTQPRWIPVSEHLPNAQTEVIVSCTDDSGDTKFRYTSSGWITTDKEYWIVDNEINNFVVAWREMPEPWKGEDDAKNDSN